MQKAQIHFPCQHRVHNPLGIWMGHCSKELDNKTPFPNSCPAREKSTLHQHPELVGTQETSSGAQGGKHGPSAPASEDTPL